MIDRLLEKLESPRRHLTLLVGLLALVFVLTAIVAWRASEADQARVNMANSALEEAAAVTLGDWAGLMQIYAGATLHSAAHLARPTWSAEALLRAADKDQICKMCSTPNPVAAVFILDPVTDQLETAGATPPGVVAAVRSLIESGSAESFHPQIYGGLYFIEVDGEVTAVYAYATLNQRGQPMRITGLVVSNAAADEMVALTLSSARKLPGAFAPDIPSARVFMTSATVGDARLLGSATGKELRTRVVDTPVYGLSLALGVHSNGGSSVFEFGESTAERTTIFFLMVVISALLITALLQVRREAQMTRLRADFVSGVSHELRTPLAQIRMFTETLLLGRVRSDVERRRSLEIIDQEARRLSHLVENVLLFSKTEGGRESPVAPEPTHFANEIRHAVDSLSLLCRSRSADVRTELQENITVPIDRMALRQILINLVDNALKYGPVGQRITVGAALFDTDARVWVDDEGPGIPAPERTRVFDSFYRLPREDQSRISGSGIGLAVVRELARLHGGDAWAEAAPGRGARIVVQFPDAYLRSEETGEFAAAS